MTLAELQAVEVSTEYEPAWEPTGLGATIFKDRYARNPEETWAEGCYRVAEHVAAAEENGNMRRYTNRFFDQLITNKFNPGGRIWYGSGRPKAQLLNCFVIPTHDSREGWGRTTSDVIIISGLMGGVGLNVSPIRPRGSIVKGTGGIATGAVSLMQLIDGVGDVIAGGGGRRMALMLCLNVNHPDLNEFLEVKLDKEQLNNANISVVIPPEMTTEEFVNKVKNGEEIELTFGGIPTGKTIDAKELWARLVKNSWESGEPGVLNGYLANKMNNLHYYRPLIATNPCGEIWLEEYGCCDLGALVLPRFVKDGQFQWDEFDESVRLGVRFLDNVLTVNHYPLPEVKENCENVRRLGLGVMGLHSMLLELGMKYDSPEAIEFVDNLFSVFKNTAYDASINLAIEKGPFPAYDPQFLDSGFAKTLKRGIRNKIKEHGIRNCALLTIAPTGTTSMVSHVSSGIEPLNPAVYWRNYYKPTPGGERELTRELVVEEAYHKYPDLVQSAVDIPVRAHFEMQRIVQKHIDNAVSKTINLANDFPEDEFGDIWLEYLPYLKGTTVYRYGSRKNEPINPVPRDQWDKVIAANKVVADEMTVEEFTSLDCVGGVCEIPRAFAEGA
jgi:ribonucleoside-diphosphate reductase alpha chain